MSWIARSAPHPPQRRSEVSNRARPKTLSIEKRPSARASHVDVVTSEEGKAHAAPWRVMCIATALADRLRRLFFSADQRGSEMPRVEPDKPGAQRRVGIEIPSTPGMSPSKETRFALPVHVATRPVSLGTHGEVCVRGEGVAPEHVFIMVREGRVFVASAKAAAPIVIERDHSPQRDQTTPARWLEIHLPCHVYVGAVSLRLFWCKAKRAEPSESSSPPSSSDERRRNPRRRVITPPPSAMLSIPTESRPRSLGGARRPWP